MSPPSPLSAPWAADEVAATTEAGSRAQSFVIVNGSPAQGIRGRDEPEVVAIDWATFGHGEPWGRRLQIRDAGAIGGNALPKDDRSDVTRFRSAAAKRVQAHCARARMGLRCLTVRVSDRTVRHLISTGYLSLERSEAAAAVAIALEAWIADNLT